MLASKSSLAGLLLILCACGAVSADGADGGPVDAALPPDALMGPCTPSTTTCENDVLIVCGADGMIADSSNCGFGCTASGDACRDLAPSNGLAAQLDTAADGPD